MRKKTKERIIAERVMNACYAIGWTIFFLAGSGIGEYATVGNYIALALSFVLLGIGLFIDKF